MATNTYVALQTQTLASSASSVTFSSIPQTYTDLVLELQCGYVSGTHYAIIRMNGDSSGNANYGNTFLAGNGSSASSGRNGGLSGVYTSYGFQGDTTLNFNATVHFMNYSNSTTYKTTLTRDNLASAGTEAVVCCRRTDTNPITSFIITPDSGASFLAGSTFTLYGVAAAGTNPAAKATGGVIYQDATYTYHAFASSGTFTPNQALTADILVVAGGGGGGASYGGGGGAGGLLAFSSQSLTNGTGYSCTVGGGGSQGYAPGHGSNGNNSSFGSLTASVGGGGGGGDAGGYNGNSGGSGGGGGGSAWTGLGGAGTLGQGYAGGNSVYNTVVGGGGGAGATSTGGIGGIGATSSIINSMASATSTGDYHSPNYYFAGGGGSNTHAGGWGGGGSPISDNQPGQANTGGGGGGWAGGSNPNWGGGSGIVIVRYAN